jgi:hypothetical protein
MERATGLDLAGKIIARVEALVAESKVPAARRGTSRIRPLPRAQAR